MHKLILLFTILVIFSGCTKSNKFYSGYIDADLTYLSSDFSGQLLSLQVARGEYVNKQKLLFKLEQLNETRNINSGLQNQIDLTAERDQLLSKLNYAKINYNRQNKLNKTGAGSQDAFDQAKQNLDVLLYQINSINAQIKNNEILTAQKIWQKERKQNVAPESGIVYDTYFTIGEYVQGGQPILSLITKKNIKAIFFVSEADLGKIKLNQNVIISTDGNNSHYQGIISYISNQAEYTPPIIYSREERQKLVFKIEMRIVNADLNQIHLGQPVTVEIK
ncbi:MAG TPA: HlyD family efflux transporter periplasmic adaptor subunit [Burkholderiales bacterium]|nr:HlyD family efflux transporter periplasmic adaptor subunit [Burkholderiales bacterium]